MALNANMSLKLGAEGSMGRSDLRRAVERAVSASELFSFVDLGQAGFRIIESTKDDAFADLIRSNVILVCSGAFEVRSNGIIISELGSGDCFGINSLYLDGEEMDGEADCVIRCRKKGALLCVSREAFKGAIEASADAMAAYAGVCNRKIHFLLGRIRDLTVQSSRERVMSYLRSHCDENCNLRLEMSKQALARRLNMSRAALFGQLAALADEGIIENKDGCVHLNHMD